MRHDADGSAFESDAAAVADTVFRDVEVDTLALDDVRDAFGEIAAIAIQATRRVAHLAVAAGRAHRHRQDGTQEPGRLGLDVFVEADLCPRILRAARKMSHGFDSAIGCIHKSSLSSQQFMVYVLLSR